ncbi:LIM and senescent cell antigen-like-containing domain protein 2 isoform X3 [Mus pahari]|uniref:LIM and senescent cell antigen-like-containing domain protein 2 isoform X3 n=1 Tax=Mus pahari TaxID=10093 RepID=UPI0011149518|nr:LIM and senescent cell antigen-like-containing domain protein 2 isoform X3 [Mus pahari]
MGLATPAVHCDVLRLTFTVASTKRYVKSKNQPFSKWQLNVPSVSYNILGSGRLGKDMNSPKTTNTGILIYGHLCRPCHNREKAKGLGKFICQRCHLAIDEQPLMFKNDPYHPDHFSCSNCGKELTSDARELKGELYCLPCHDKMGIPICGACRRPIEGRVVNALGKQWHVEHFVCAKCEKPFLGHRHYEKKGLAYCETHYNQLFGDVCYNCSHVIEGDVVSALSKAWCVNCFACSTCNMKLTLKNKFVEFDMKPVCKRCYERFPLELKKRLKKLSDLSSRKAQPKSVDVNSV